MGDEAEQLAEAAKLPWEDRFVHKFWKARVAAYEAVVKEASLCETVDDSACLKAFGAFEIERVSPRTRPDARGAVQILASTPPRTTLRTRPRIPRRPWPRLTHSQSRASQHRAPDDVCLH